MLEAMLATDDYTHYSIDEHPVRPARGEVWPAPGGPILISADRRYLWRQLKTCFGVADPDPDAPLEDKLRARARVMAAWFAAHQDRDALKRDLETARLAWADIRHAEDVLAAPSVAGRDTIVEVTDGDGGEAVGGADAVPVQRRRLRSRPRRPRTRRAHRRRAPRLDRHAKLPGRPACPPLVAGPPRPTP